MLTPYKFQRNKVYCVDRKGILTYTFPSGISKRNRNFPNGKENAEEKLRDANFSNPWMMMERILTKHFQEKILHGTYTANRYAANRYTANRYGTNTANKLIEQKTN